MTWREWLVECPPGTMVPASEVLARLDTPELLPEPAPPPTTWRERLWTVPPETRIGRDELLEATGRKKAWLYAHTARGTIPHCKLDGELVFVVGEIREWLRQHEERVVDHKTSLVRRPRRSA